MGTAARSFAARTVAGRERGGAVIVIRDVFELHFGKAKEAIELLQQGRELLQSAGYPVERLLADMTGPYYTLVMESRVESLAQLEQRQREAPEHEEWERLFGQLVPLVRQGRREVFRELDG